jgi:hypothetical protein
MLTYAEAEAVLAKLFGVGPALQKGALRSRLKRLKTLGVPLNVTPGTGAKVRYEHDVLFQWHFALECEEFGINPKEIHRLLVLKWTDIILPGYRIASRHEVQVYFYIRPNFMTDEWEVDKPQSASPLKRCGFVFAQNFAELMHDMRFVPRVCIFDLTRAVREIDKALGGHAPQWVPAADHPKSPEDARPADPPAATKAKAKTKKP